MNPVHFRKLPKLSISSTLASFLLVIILVACGTNPVTISSPAQSYPGNTVNKPVTTSSSLGPNAADISIDGGSLRIQSSSGFQCPGPNQLVLASNRTTYSQDEIAQIRSYTESFGTKGEPPSTLRWVLGGSMDPIPGTDENIPLCGVTLNLTNTGNTPLQIPNVGVQLETRPQQNTYQYRLIDFCSVQLPPQKGCFLPSGGGSDCSEYSASIQLGMGEKGTIYSVMPIGEGKNCGILTIAPAAQVKLILNFSLAANIPKNLIYSILPVFTVGTAQEKHTLPLSQLVSTLAFASTNQFSCYALQGTIFVLLKSPSISTNWCI